ncbi:GtrA family protein [Streptococcus orisratti]|uniref:GtrA family protein n=1 Tax=Streptococcus orisratti TaxID=114652 RepID=UPI00035FB465|nr:GtrA family protein [Streptococcus orisratti]
MKEISSIIKTFIKTEVFRYLFFGVLTTAVYIVSRDLLFTLTREATISALLANAVAITFAFFTNDYFVFAQERDGWGKRFIKFFLARLSTLALDIILVFLFVEQFPEIIGQFVHHDLTWINRIETYFSQILIMITNYLISKLLVFKDQKR